MPADDFQQFVFTGDLGDFSLGGMVSRFFFARNPGSYRMTENAVDDWILTDITCSGDTDGGSRIDFANATVTIDFDAGEDIECTFTNERVCIVVDSFEDEELGECEAVL